MIWMFLSQVRYRFVSFFFQAEDGIRDGHVTGVQTCALPISARICLEDASKQIRAAYNQLMKEIVREKILTEGFRIDRSEERRVGKEWRSRWTPYDDREGRMTVWTERHNIRHTRELVEEMKQR